tara:strand:+ start:219 stop:620 length:402 start_codon:yes stop_codon:yes gene_type:complete
MIKAKGYIFSRQFLGERAPQHVQNIVIRDFCNKNSIQYLLSASEYKMKNSYTILMDLINNMQSYDAIVAYSVFQLPEKDSVREQLLKRILKKNKRFYFAVEEIKFSKANDIKTINKLWKIKKKLPFCYKYTNE